MTTKQAFTVEPEENSCEHCGRSRYNVVGPDGYFHGIVYNDREDAEEAASDLNAAYALGLASTVKP